MCNLYSSTTNQAAISTLFRVVILALFVALIGTVTFAVNRLFTSSATPESAVTAAADFVAKQTNLTTDRIHFTGMAADNDAYLVTYSVPTIGNDFTVRVAKKDGTVTQVIRAETLNPVKLISTTENPAPLTSCGSATHAKAHDQL